eukprot:CAMPEP_0206145464 /NCGR_PEP_ID=MMETSP1473-20131121/27430_1 /ASSEMBLY_ACC=CAM_ASM_001109 /TAXON_ID=1461547 /ORGANISM="Stichococcus sp, Strain RCC1054" /LENGTH=138 /DNA_ID=CAMNT_0053541691 /DNA_START=295 /DNA_END=707 /DNA_ORIENTATION=-
MAALRQLVTGSDVCAPSDGSGGSAANAASALADQLLGRTNKAQERLRELPGANVAPAGPSAQAPVYAPTVADAARAVAEGDAMFWPGAPAFRQHPQATDFADEFLRQQGALPPGAPPGFHQAGPQHPIGRGPLQPMMP